MPPHGGVLVALWLLLAPGVTEFPRSGTGGATLAFVFDVTGSMYDDLVQVMDGASRILERTLSRSTRPIGSYVLVPFHDPEVGPATLTSDPRLFQQRLRELQVQGGGDCPEMSVAAIRLATELSQPSSFIYVFSDARAKDYELQEELLRLLQHKQSQVVFVLTGDCGDRSHPGYRVYERIAATSSGQIFHLDKQQVKEVLKWVEEAIQASKVHLLSTDHEDGGEHAWPIPFDPSLKEVTVSLSGPAPSLEVLGPAGKALEKGRELKELLSIPNSAVVVALEPREPGTWLIKTQSSGRHSLRVTGVSSINFQAGFSTQPDLDGSQPAEQPVQGLPISVVVNCTGLEPPGRLREVELLNSSGHALLSLPLSNASSGRLWVGSALRAPPGDFLLKVKGEDAMGHPLQRLSSVTYSSVVPGLPEVDMPSRIQAYSREPQRISCRARSQLPFRLQLSRAGTKLGREQLFRGLGNSSWLIPAASKSDEGFYECTATNKVGATRARAFVSVSEPPPRLLAPSNVTASPGQDVLLSCPVLGDAPYNLTWSWDGMAARHGDRARLLHNHSLQIGRVQPGDAGPYECIASNAHGTATASVWLLVQEAPWVKVDASPQRFSRGQGLRLNCTAGGVPPPRTAWARRDRALQLDQRVFTDVWGTLHIRDAVPEDAGNYSCSATSPLGRDEQGIVLQYREPPAILAVTPSVKALVGEDVTLECWVMGVPPPQISWHKGEQEVAAFPAGSERGVLRLQAVRPEDAGPYVCQAHGDDGTAFASTALSVGSAPHFPEPLGDLAVRVGDSVTLLCRAEGSPPPRVSWSRQDGQRVAGQHGLLGAELLIDGASLDDQAVYVCEAQNEFGKIQAEVKLTVTGQAPEIAATPPVLRVLEGQPVSLSCELLAGQPLPTRRWLKDGQEVAPSSHVSTHDDGSLHMARVAQGDAGTYSCLATNALGSHRQDVALLVHVPPSIEHGPVLVTTTEGVAVTLQCNATGVPPPTITWAKDTEPISPSPRHHLSHDGTLLIPSPSPGDDGTYVCTATSAAGTASHGVQLSVSTKPRIRVNGSQETSQPIAVLAVRGQETTLPCAARGSPPPVVAWTRGAQPLPLPTARLSILPSGSLLLAEPQPTDSGLYTCTATNTMGNTSLRYSLHVQDPPHIQRGPAVLQVLVGQRLELPCVAHGDPVPRLSWSRDSHPLRVGEGRVLEGPGGAVAIGAVQLSDAGRYRCIASSSAGQDAVEVDVQVLEPPYLEDGAEVRLEKALHENVTIPCPAKGTPTPSIVWWKDAAEVLGTVPGAVVLDGGSLLIHALQPGHGGDYTCLATNAAGSISRTTTLVVHVPTQVLINNGESQVMAIANDSLSIRCHATGVPMPQLRWLKDGRPLDTGDGVVVSEDGGTLHIAHVGLSHGGVYVCQGSSRAGESQAEVQVLVQVPPNIEPNVVDLAVLENSTVSLQCLATGVPALDITWYKGSEQLVSSPGRTLSRDGKRLEILSARLPDAGSYRCVAGDTERWYSLRVTVPPRITAGPSPISVVTNTPVTLRCDAMGSPAPVLVWLKDGNPVPSGMEGGPQVLSDGRVLSLPTPHLPDAGTYTCVASSAVGEDRHEATLEVRLPHSTLGEEENISVIVNEEVTLRCPAPGAPPNMSRWLKDGALLTPTPRVWLSEEGTVLQMGRAAVQDAGRYTCQAPGHPEQHYNLHVWEPPSFSSAEPIAVPVLQGQSTRLSCECHGVPYPALSWHKDGEPLSSQPGSPKLVSAGGRLLYIEKVQPVDEGTYTCECSNAAGSSSKEHRLLVHVPPRIQGSSKAPRKVSVIKAGETVLECKAEGTPVPAVTWLKDGQPLGSGDGLLLMERGQRLRIVDAAVAHAGRYTCLVTNTAGQERREFEVAVHVPPEIIPGSGLMSNVSVPLHGALTLPCEATGVPLPAVTWSRSGSPVTPSEHAHVLSGGWMLRLPRARAQDGGHYSCLASNVAGEARREFYVEVLVPPHIENMDEEETTMVPEGHPVTWSCLAEGNPQPNITWLKDGHPLPDGGTFSTSPDGSVLHIPSAALSDAGRYSCVASNTVAERAKHYLLDVLAASPMFAGDTHDAVMEDVTVVINNPISLVCEAPSLPPPNITWLKDEVPLHGSRNVRLLPGGHGLQILNAQEEDAGTYSCVVASGDGEDVRNYTVRVLVPPWIARDDPLGEFAVKEVKTRVNSTVMLECEAWAVPEPTIQWYKDGQLLRSAGHLQILSAGQVLRIHPAGSLDSGHYTCVATNAAGEDDRDFSVHVQVPPLFQEQMGSSDAFEIFYREEDGDGEVTEHRQAVLHQPAALYCDTNTVPPPRLTWYKDGEPLSPSPGVHILLGGRVLQLLAVQEQDAGRYTCEAASEAGRDRMHYELEVLAVPAIRGAAEDGVEEVMATANSTVRFECEATGYPVPSVSWLWGDVPIAAGPRHQLLEGGTVLQVVAVRAGDAGSYVCVAENLAGSAEKHFALMVQEPPALKPLPAVLMVMVNTSAVLSCEATGVPQPEVTWQKDGISITTGPGIMVLPSGQLHLPRASAEDAGGYVCVAHNPSGTATGRTRLVVQVPPLIDSGPTALAVREGQDVLLPCAARGVPEPRVSWSRRGSPLRDRAGTTTVLPSGDLLLRRVQEGDAGSYSCTAVNSAGRAVRQLSLSIHTVPTFTRQPGDVALSRGERLQLECAAAGSPQPRVSWWANGQPVTDGVVGQWGRSTLQRAAVTHADSGTYVCRAENSAGTITATSFISVTEAPVVQGPPSTYQAEPPGGDAILDCDARGHPVPLIRWSKDGVPVGSGGHRRQLQNGSLAIHGLGSADVGLYRCVAENEVGTAAKVVTVVLQSVPTVTVTPQAVLVRTGQRVLLHCNTSGEPTPSLEWQRDGEALLEGPRAQVLPNATLLLPAAGPRDAGTYTCVARSPLGSAAAHATLIVRGEPRRMRGSLRGVINSHEFRVAALNASVQDDPRSGTAAVRTSISGIPRDVGPLMRVLVALVAPIYWSFAHAGGDAPSGVLLTRGTFRHETQVEFSTGDLLRITHVARGADATGTLLLDSVISGSVPRSLGDAKLLLQDFSERYVQTGAGRLTGSSVQSFLQDGLLARARCNHTIEYQPAPGPRPPRVQQIRAREVRASFDPASEELHFQLSASLSAGEQCPAGFVLSPQQLHCVDIDECAEGSHGCRYNQRCENTVGTHRCVCPPGYRWLGASWPCLDINECLQFPPPCAFACRNLRGSYECLCPPGTTPLPHGDCSTGAAGGAAGSTPRPPPLLRLRPSVWGRLYPRLTLSRVPKAAEPGESSPCPVGFVRRSGSCMDLDECQLPRQCQHECRNSEGSYRCVCPPGYRLLPDGRSCRDVDECAAGAVQCNATQLCFNTRGGAHCEDTPCPDGYWSSSSPGVCISRCAPFCGPAGPAVLHHVLLPLPLGVPPAHDVLRLTPGAALGARVLFAVLEQDPGSPFALRTERGRGIVSTLRPLLVPGTHRLRVQAVAPGAWRQRSIFLIIITISPYPY